jgi:hypothetical protein
MQEAVAKSCKGKFDCKGENGELLAENQSAEGKISVYRIVLIRILFLYANQDQDKMKNSYT